MGKILPVIIVLLFAIIAGFPLFHKGLIPTHDGEYHVVRFFLFNEAFNDGNLYPRWAAHLNNGFGVPLFIFVYPLPNYIAVFFHWLGISFIDSFRLEMFAAILTGSIFFYLWAKEFWGRLGGIVSSIFYTFSPYHFVDIYIRGSIGEVWALAFFPAFLWSYTVFAKSNKKIFFIFSSLLLALIILSHNILALMFFLFSLSYVALLIYMQKNKKYLIRNTLYLLLLGLGMSSIFWLPAIYETKYITGLEIFDVTAHFPQLYQLLIPSWGSGFSGAGLQNELSFQIGIANLIAVFLSVLTVTVLTIQRKKINFYIIFFLIWFILILFLMLDISKAIWRTVPFLNYFQFPWRLLSIEILFASFLAGSIFSLRINKRVRIFFAICLIFSTFILGIGYTKPAYYHYRDDDYYTSRSNFTDGTNSPGNVFNTKWFNPTLKRVNKKLYNSETLEVRSELIKSAFYKFNILNKEQGSIVINTAYFPGWNAYINGKESKTSPDKNGLVTFFVPKGDQNLEVKFEDTPIRKFAAFVSLTSLIIIFALFIQKRFVTINR